MLQHTSGSLSFFLECLSSKHLDVFDLRPVINVWMSSYDQNVQIKLNLILSNVFAIYILQGKPLMTRMNDEIEEL